MNKVHFYRPMINRSNPSLNQSKTTFIPASNISKDENGYTLEVAIPGFTKDELEIILEENYLKIVGNFEPVTEIKQQFIHRNFAKQAFEISFKLSDTINTDTINAKVENGLLTIHLALRIEAKKEVKNITII